MTKPHTTRIAPSPTGLLHLGTARTALFCWLAAKASGGRFLLRIDDTDAARNLDSALAVIDDGLAWLGLDHDARFRQSDRGAFYSALADGLIAAGLARRDDGAVRLNLPLADVPRRWTDTVGGAMSVGDKDAGFAASMVLLRSDGSPTYHFASVADDMDTGVTWVIRGTDHISNTARQVALWTALGRLDWSGAATGLPLWTHVGLVTYLGRKMSKRDGAASLLSYRDAGIHPEAMCNFLLRLGWGPSVDDKTARTIDRTRAVSLFLDAGRMRPSPANMDPMLLAALDRRYKGRDRAAALGDAAAGPSPPATP